MEKLTIVRDGNEIALTEDEILKIYRYQQFQFRIQDVEYHLEDMVEKDDMSEEDAARFTEDDIERIASIFIDKQDCNCDENSLFEEIIKSYYKDVIIPRNK